MRFGSRMLPPSVLAASMWTGNTCVARRVSSTSPAGWNRFATEVPIDRPGSPSGSHTEACAPFALAAAGESTPPSVVPSSVMCQLIVNGASMSANRSIDVSRIAWSPKRTSRTHRRHGSRGRRRDGRDLRVRVEERDAGVGLGARKLLSPSTSGPSLPSMIARARPRACAAARRRARPPGRRARRRGPPPGSPASRGGRSARWRRAGRRGTCSPASTATGSRWTARRRAPEWPRRWQPRSRALPLRARCS